MFSDDKSELLEELDRLLALQISIYQKFLDLEVNTKALLTSRSIDNFIINIQEKERLSQHLICIERKRCGVAERLAALLQIPVLDMTLAYLITQVAEPHAIRLLHYRERLQQLVRDVQRCCDDNARYLQGALSFFNEAVAFFQSVVPDHMTYRRSGQSTYPHQGRILSRRV